MERCDNRSLDIYLAELDDVRNAPLDAETEKELFYGWEHKTKQEKEAVEEALVRANLRFAIRVATRYKGRGLAMDDLVSLANTGLLRATKDFDPTKNLRFISYAVWWIREAILKAINNETDALRFPGSQKKDLHHVRRCQAEFYAKNERMPSDIEILSKTGMNRDQLDRANVVQMRYASLNERIGPDSDKVLLDQITDTSSLGSDLLLERKELSGAVRSMIGLLAPRDADIMIRYFGLNGEEPQTLEEIGKVYGLTRERVRQIKQKVIEGLKKKPSLQRLALEVLE